ncbi:MAG TPA: ABC transporter ATP-binding protein [Symbiobacteriaceae bacterium]
MILIEDVTVQYPGRPPVVALQDLSLRIPPGVSLIKGASGSGKSTLLRLLAGLVSPTAGRIRHGWLRSRGPSEDVALRLRLGYVPQHSRMDVELTALDGLRYLAATRGLPADAGAVWPLLRRWGLEAQARTPIRRLSTGQALRWLLAQSQLTAPALWLLDEPGRGLDAEGMVTLRRELSRYRQAVGGLGPRFAVVATQDGSLDDLADRIFWLDRGRLLGWA